MSHCSSRNVDSCTSQLGRWNPFVSPPHPPPDPDPSLSAAPPALLNCSFKDFVSRSLHSQQCRNLAARLDAQTWDSTRKAQDVVMPEDLGPDVLQLCGVGECLPDESGYICQTASNSNVCGKVPSSMAIVSLGFRGWSKRHKQLSRALVRGLWRWREGSRARKRRRKVGSSRSGSGRSSDSRRGGPGAWICASDPPTVAASAAYATCSDIPMPGTDSSGELFFNGEGSGISLDPEIFSSGEGVAHKRDVIDLYHVWLATETQNLESGYGSETGYRGDGELGYEDDGYADEQEDEEEKEPLHLSPWRNNVTKVVSSSYKSERIAEVETLDEDCLGDLVSSSDLKLQHRLRRRRQDWRLFNGQKSAFFTKLT